MIPLLPRPVFRSACLFLPPYIPPRGKHLRERTPNQIVLWNHPKTHQMIAYGCIGWLPKKESPFYAGNVPEITKLFSLRGYKDSREVSALVDQLERIMSLRGHLRFGATVKTTETEQLSFFLKHGYEITLLNEAENTAYLLKKRELLEAFLKV